MVPIVNLEWIQAFATPANAALREAVMDSVVRSMEDYINFIRRNFPHPYQLSARADGGHLNPFAAGNPRWTSFVVIHFRNLQNIDFHGCWRCCGLVYLA